MNHIYYRGWLLPPDKAAISLLNSGLWFGESLFETIPVYGEKPLFLKDHLERFARGCHFLGWSIPPAVEFKKAIGLFTQESKDKAGFLIRFNLSQELIPPVGPRTFSYRRPVFFATIRPLRHDIQSPLPQGGRIGISPWRALHASMAPNRFKLASLMVTRSVLKKHSHWDEMLRLNEQGEVVDGAGATPMWFDGKKLHVPTLNLGGLESVTRGRVLGLCGRLGIRIAERPWKAGDALKKGELLFVGSGVGVLGASQLLGKKLASSAPFTLRLWQHYRHWALSNKKF